MAENKAGMMSVAIVGLGYVGLPLAMLFEKHGFHVVGVDIDQHKIDLLNQHKSYLSDLTDEQIAILMKHHRFQPTTDFSRIRQTSACILCVPTPLRHERYPDLSHLQSAVMSMIPHLAPQQLIVLESSTFPGTTEEVIKPLLEKEGFQIGKHIFLGYSPERIDPGNMTYLLEDVPKVISGVTKACVERVKRLYGQVFRHLVPVSKTRHAEMTKLLENSQRLVNISFMNEIMMLCHKMDINIWEVIEAAKTKPYGFTAYYPGPGAGGHCIPVDPMYLNWKAEEYDFTPQFIHLAKKINDLIPHYIVERMLDILPEKKARETRILLIGLTYKKDVNDVRESPAITILNELIQLGLQVDYHDPFVPQMIVSEQTFSSVNLSPQTLKTYDGIVILTDHSHIDYSLIVKHAPLVFDTRHVLDGQSDNVHHL